MDPSDRSPLDQNESTRNNTSTISLAYPAFSTSFPINRGTTVSRCLGMLTASSKCYRYKATAKGISDEDDIDKDPKLFHNLDAIAQQK